jgi:hypothetical protein
MTDSISNEDQQWLDALAGRESLNPNLNAHAQSVRQALHQRRQEIEADAAKDRAAELTQLRARLEVEGLLRPESDKDKSWVQKLLAVLFLDPHFGRTQNRSNLTLSRGISIAILMLFISSAVWFSIQERAPKVDEALIYRGDPNVVTLLVDDPELRAKSLEAGLKSLPSVVTVKAVKPSGWVVQVQDSESVREYLLKQRIEGVVVDGHITLLVLSAVNVKP